MEVVRVLSIVYLEKVLVVNNIESCYDVKKGTNGRQPIFFIVNRHNIVFCLSPWLMYFLRYAGTNVNPL